LAEEASTPAYQADTTVRNNANAITATPTPMIVSVARSLWRSELRKRSFNSSIVPIFNPTVVATYKPLRDEISEESATLSILNYPFSIILTPPFPIAGLGGPVRLRADRV